MLNPNLSPEENIKRIYDKPEWVSYVDDRLRYREYLLPDNLEESVDQLVAWYENKRSKRVKYAGQKLKKMFLILPPVEQRKVGMALLGGNKADSEWVCIRLNNHKSRHWSDWVINWHPCYATRVEECWNRYHSKACGKLMVQFLDEEVVKKYLDELSDRYYYFLLCRRFVGKPWFQLDVEKLRSCTHINAYLSVMAKTKEGILKEEARRLLYQWIAIVLTLNHGRLGVPSIWTDIFLNKKTNERRVINTWGFDTALYYMLCMGLDEVVEDFLEWDEKVRAAYLAVTPKCIEGEVDYDRIFCETAMACFPDDIKYFLKVRGNYFDFCESPGRPLVVPKDSCLRRCFEVDIEEEFAQMNEILSRIFNTNKSEPNLANPREKDVPQMSEEDFDRMVKENPNMQRMIDVFGLSRVDIDFSAGEDDESESPLSTEGTDWKVPF